MPLFPETILAQASAPGFSPRAIIRASGPGCPDLLAAALELPIPGSRSAATCRLRLSGDRFTLPALLTRFIAPHSYTAEDAFELSLPGNPFLIDRLIQQLLSIPLNHPHPHPARLANPGEFSARAYLNGRLTIEQAEGIASLISARSAAQLDAAQRLLSGNTGNRYRQWAEELLALLALVEAGIDFTDQEDVIAIDARTLDHRLAQLQAQMHEITGNTQPAAASSALPTVALVGPPNAGKSTLFNTLLGRTRAVVSDIRGTTRDVLREKLELSRDVPAAGAVDLLDLPGLDADAIREGPSAAAAQDAARAAIREADVILHCDPTGRFVLPPETQPSPRARFIRVRTKADLPTPTPDDPRSLSVCALDGWHIGPLRRAIADAATIEPSAAGDVLAIPRHRRIVLDTLAAITACRDNLNADAPDARLSQPELLAESLRRASESMGELTGRIAPDDVLGRIFSTFCIGK
ncbi:MAG: 50S ribosome-binding GTPase [Phycisphaerales bacterium]|nr:50S ribosome-binding GTPase [Phycisphaerales bacterium]